MILANCKNVMKIDAYYMLKSTIENNKKELQKMKLDMREATLEVTITIDPPNREEYMRICHGEK